MQLDKTSFVVSSLILASDEDGVLQNVTPAEDPDNVPSHLPSVVYSFVPTPFSEVFDEFLVELTFWYDNPDMTKISKIIDTMEKSSGHQWHDILEDGSSIGKFQFFFIRSPSTGGRQSFKFITLFLKIRATYSQDQC